MEIVSNPLAQFSTWFAQAVSQPGYNHDAMAIATVDEDNHPDVRYVLLKRIDENGLEFFTNKTSVKAHQLGHNANIACAMYWVELGRQVRVRGPVDELDKETVAKYFATRGRGSQLGAWASKQSSPLDDMTTLQQRQQELEQKFQDQEVPAPEFWTGYKIVPLAIEFWQEGKNRLHERIRYTRSNPDSSDWQATRLYP